MNRAQWKGMGTFSAIWAGQFLSLLGTGMAQFAMTIWAWQKTGQATALALVGVCAFAPVIVVSPLAGAIVDRTSRKLLMILADAAAGVGTLTILLLHLAGALEIWQLYIIVACIGAFGAFQFPAYSSTISVLVDKSQYARASGMMSLAGSVSGVFSPVAAGGLLRDAAQGFRYIFARRGLLSLLGMFFLFNVTTTFGFTVLAPMILARTGNDSLLLGSVQSAAGIGGVVGGVLLSVWGGPKRRIRCLLFGCAGGGVIGLVGVGVGRSLPVWTAAMFLMSTIFPTVNASSQSVWQSKVPPDLQGRVFSVRLMLAQLGTPLAMLLAGPLADRVFEPGMRAGGRLAAVFAPLVGTGPGAGMALMLVFAGLLSMVASLAAHAYRPLRSLETTIPDHDQPVTPAAPAVS